MNFNGHIPLTNPNKAKPIKGTARRVKMHTSMKPMKMGVMKTLSRAAGLRPSQVSNLGAGVGGMQKARRLK